MMGIADFNASDYQPADAGSKKNEPRVAARLGGAIAPGDQVEPVKPFLITVNTSSSETPRRLSIS
jgi:hypothetical protein